MIRGGAPQREVAATVSLVALELAVSLWVLHAGFTHISDDDYARVTIAQAFAHAPRLDPSGTSWLPFPFWVSGAAMMLFGRSLAVARAVALASAAAGVAIVYRALRQLPMGPSLAWLSVAVAMCTPWNAWLGAATVPEALCGALIATGALTMAHRGTHLLGSVCLLVASLSRYEAWPVAGLFAVACLLSLHRSPARVRVADFVPALLALLGPLLWMAWNAHAHADPLHFLARVAAYRRHLAAGEASWTLYPAAFARAAPEVVVLLCLGSVALPIDPGFRSRWGWPLLALIGLVTFLILGQLNDGVPTHHPERALVACIWLGTAFGVDGGQCVLTRLARAGKAAKTTLVAVATGVTVMVCVLWPARVAAFPGQGESEERAPQIALGVALRKQDVPHVSVTPCAYEHFAVIAAFGAPERVTVMRSTGRPVGAECPEVELR